MDPIENFNINYWGKDFSYSGPQKRGSSTKKKLAIIFSFILLLVIFPSLIFSLANINLESKKEISSTAGIISPTQETIQDTSNQTPNEGTVIKNDSYWKISKRYCGVGTYYLTIQEKNDSKPLFVGDKVLIDCR